MICYHGSDTVVDAPKILDAKRPLDFGGGFYVTTSREQANKWAIMVSYRNNSSQKCLNIYEFDLEKAKQELNVISFEYADDKVYRVVVEYENGDVDKERALEELKSEALCDQILFHTEKSLKWLTYIKTEVS